MVRYCGSPELSPLLLSLLTPSGVKPKKFQLMKMRIIKTKAAGELKRDRRGKEEEGRVEERGIELVNFFILASKLCKQQVFYFYCCFALFMFFSVFFAFFSFFSSTF